MGKEQISDSLKLHLENYSVDGNTLCLYVNTTPQGQKALSAQELSVMIGRQEAKVVSAELFSDSGEGVSYVCLVDVSGSLDAERMQQMKAVVTGLTKKLGKNDNLCVIAMGDTLRSSGFLSDQEELSEVIKGLSVLREDTNLYQGIAESLTLLQTDGGVNARRCLVVLSDGAEDNTYGITREEVNEQIRDSGIPVYTVGMLKDAGSSQQLESIKLLGSFARISAGGVSYVPKQDGFSAKQIASDIRTSLQHGQIITVDTTGLTPAGQEVYLQVAVESSELGSAKTGINIPDHMILTEQPAGESEHVEQVQDSQTELSTETHQPDSGQTAGGHVPVIAGAAAALAVVLIVLAVLFRKKKHKSADAVEETSVTASEDAVTVVPDAVPAGGQPDAVPADTDAEDIPAETDKTANQGMAAAVPAAGIPVRLIRIGQNETKEYQLLVTERFCVGRSQQADFALAEDRSLSDIHCIFSYRCGRLYIRDNHSTNGTYVNGIPVREEAAVCSDDIVLIGSYEYRVCYESR